MKKTLITILACITSASMALALDIDLFDNDDADEPRTYAIQEDRVIESDALTFPLSGYRLADPADSSLMAAEVTVSQPLRVLPEDNTRIYLRRIHQTAPNHR